jgi:precorrin-6B methylase 2
MNVTIKKTLTILAMALLVVTPVLYLRDFLCFEGFLSGMTYYTIILALLVTLSVCKTRLKKISLDVLIIFQLVYISIIPIGMLINSNNHGGFDFFLNERLPQYIYQESVAMLVLILSSALYAKEKALYTGKLRTNLLSPLAIALIVRLLWIMVFESRHLENFATTMPHLKVEYVVLVSIPLFWAILILIIYRNLAGYILGFFLALAHIVLVLLLVIMKANPGFGPIIVCLSSLAICIFSVREIMEYHFNNNIQLPRLMQFIMRTVLRIRYNPKNITHILELAGVKENMRVLDYGCGIGNYAIETAKMVGESGIVVCADVNDKMLQELRKRVRGNELVNVNPILVNSVENIQESDFDLILLIDVLHLIKDKIALINSLLKRLSDNGKLFIKFEHFDNEQIGSLLNSCQCSDKRAIHRQYWLLNN